MKHVHEHGLSKDGAELAIYMFVAIVCMFEMHFGKLLQNVGPKRIESIHEENMEMLDRLTGADKQQERPCYSEGCQPGRCRSCYSTCVKRCDVQIKFRPLRTKGGSDEDDLRLSMEERVALVWPLTLDAWAFEGEPVAESRLPRHIGRVLRGRR
jgi:hypothetical protein